MKDVNDVIPAELCERRPRGARTLRAAGTALMVALLSGLVPGCSLSAARSDEAASEAARTYVDLIATGDSSDLEALWRTTASEDPGAMRIAGDLLAGATERIEVLEVGAASEATGVDTPSVALESWLTNEARQVPVRYRLAGEEHDALVVLAPRDDAFTAEAADWVVVGPLVGTIGFAPTIAEVPMDLYLSGTRLVSREEQVTYPAVYAVEERGDPYFATVEPATVTVTAGAVAPAPEIRVQGTAATAEALAVNLQERFEVCGNSDGFCAVRELMEPRGIDVYEPDWYLGLLTEPTISMDGNNTITMTGGVFAYRDADGVEVQVPFGGSGYWALDRQDWVPVLVELTLTEETA